MTVGALGEFGLIERIVGRLGAPPPPAGPGDDAAVVPAPDGRLVASTDLLVEGCHFRLDWSSPYDVGRKAAAQNLADVAAMGAVPTALLVGLAAPADLPVAVADGLADGLRDECVLVGAAVVGGDLVRSDGGLTVAVTALGDLEGRSPVTRGGGRPGELVVLAGTVGRSAAGLALLTAGDPALLREFPGLVAAHRRPTPPYDEGPRLAALGATAMCDVSDGLAQDVGHLAAASGVRIELSLGALRAAGARELAEAAAALRRAGLADTDLTDAWLLRGGEDHGLVATLPPAAARRAGLPVVGRVAAGQGVWLVPAGQPVPVALTGGFDHFR